jgi:hypothetical protein
MREIRIEEEHEEQVISQVTQSTTTSTRNTIYPEVRQPHKEVPTFSLLR